MCEGCKTWHTGTCDEYRRHRHEYLRQWRKKNHKRILEQEQKYRNENRERIREEQQNYRNKNRERIREYERNYRKENLEKALKREAAYREAHRDLYRETQNAWYSRNRNQARAASQAWMRAHPDQYRATKRRNNKDRIDRLADDYVLRKLKQSMTLKLKTTDIPRALIEAKRAQLMIHRLITKRSTT